MNIRFSRFRATAGVLAACTVHAFAQTIPNAGFENWTGGNPDDWKTTNTQQYVTVTQSSDAHGGASSMMGQTISLGPVTLGANVLAGADGHGFPCTTEPAALHGFYKFNQAGNDSLVVLLTLSDASNSGMGAGRFSTRTSQTTYKEFVATMYYSGQGSPATMNIGISNGVTGSTVGTTFNIDDLSFGEASAVDENGNLLPSGFDLEQNYPNPFNPSTSMIYDVPERTHVKLVVRDMVGRTVATLVDETATPGRYKVYFVASGLGSGSYLYTLTTGSYSRTRLMTLIK